MENKKIDILFGVVVIAFLLCIIVLMRDIRILKTNDYKEYVTSLATIVKVKNFKMQLLAGRLAEAQKENMDLQNTLAETRNDLDALSKKLSAPAAPVPVPAAAPAK